MPFCVFGPPPRNGTPLGQLGPLDPLGPLGPIAAVYLCCSSPPLALAVDLWLWLSNATMPSGPPRGRLGTPKGTLGGPQGAPWGPQGDPWEPLGAPWGPQGAPGDPKGVPRHPGPALECPPFPSAPASGIYILYESIYIYILAWTCEYPSTEICGSDNEVALQWCCQTSGLSSVSSLHFDLKLVFPGLDLFGEAGPPGTLTCRRV